MSPRGPLFQYRKIKIFITETLFVVSSFRLESTAIFEKVTTGRAVCKPVQTVLAYLLSESKQTPVRLCFLAMYP